MSKINDGGTAFPMQDQQAIHTYAVAAVEGLVDTDERERAYMKARAEAVGGMSLRDYFAAKALPAVYVDAVREMNVSGFPDEHWRDGIAIDAYAMADAMIKAREQS